MNEEGVRAPRERKQYDNFKPLPRDIPEETAEVELPNIIMGRNPVKEAIKTGRSIDRILVTNEHDGSLNEILDLAFEAKLVVRNVDRSKLDEICMPFGHNGRTGNHQGIIAYVPEAQYCELSDILDYAAEKGEHPFVVLLDGIEDPHNLGSIIRSAECAGAHGIVIPKRRAASVTATVVKTSAGATEHMKIAKVVNLPVAIERLKEAGVWVAGADMGGEPMYKADLKGPFALVVGAEGAGLSRLVREKCDYIVSVPLKGKMESLNASVAAAVIMFEKVRQENN
ncbi:MAG: 23S rRNA (guanosine(2251)-2'-O)-methyltransferase RlmB [Clostridia bacterium]|nr:23S rRNA (guanosine(2251)-2'-O)-methyltransferase RlmB [Clostridia bacterium]